MDTTTSVPRIHAERDSCPVKGQVRWAPVKSVWISTMTGIALLFGPSTLTWQTAALFITLCGFTLCLGHSLGMHRRFVHNSYECPLWLEYALVYLGTLVGMAGPLGMLRTHDLRDWAQRQPQCHDYFAHRRPLWQDYAWQLHADIDLAHPPAFVPEDRVANSRFYQWLERTWMLQQLPVALGLFAVGGWAWVVWGVCARVAVCVTGHWLVGHFAHRTGHQDYLVHGAGVQGYNVGLGGFIGLGGLITMGECWHNNHHAFPGSAHLGLHAGQLDPGWWVLQVLKRMGLVWQVQEPHDLPLRPQVQRCSFTAQPTPDPTPNPALDSKPNHVQHTR
jgi:sn-1 stearoyl-lipid 9-desaturase